MTFHIRVNTWNSAGGSIPEKNMVGLKSYSLAILEDEVAQVVARLRNNGFTVTQEGDMYFSQGPSGNMVYFG